jgi:hypothetical protein
MAVFPTGTNLAFDRALVAAELVRQNAMAAAGGNAGAVRAADIQFLTSVVAAGTANGVATLNEQQALSSIQTTGNP